MLEKAKAASQSLRETSLWAESYLSQLFYRHGILCASYPYVSLALSFVLIFFLSYPVLDQARNAYLSTPNSNEYVPIWDVPSSRAPWQEEQFRAAYGEEPLLQLEQVIVHFGNGSDLSSSRHFISRENLLSTLKLQRALLDLHVELPIISDEEASGQTTSRVVRRSTAGFATPEASISPVSTGSPASKTATDSLQSLCFIPAGSNDCIVFTPLSYWNSDPSLLQLDPNLGLTIGDGSSKSPSEASIPSQAIFGGFDLATKDGIHADSVILSFALNASRLQNGVDIAALWDTLWTTTIEELNNVSIPGSTSKSLYHLHKDPGDTKALYHKSNSRGTIYKGEALLLSASYLIVFLYISLVVGRVDLVKSKFALGFGAVFAVVCSMLMSVGLCSMLGIRTSLVPWEVLPFLIIAVGVENIFVLTNAVVMTSLDLPVKERVGLGLARVGVPMLATLGWEMCFLLLGSLIDIPALQEFCLFGAVSIVIDYFMQITFFATILSIDIRRLELSELHKLRKVQIAQEHQAARDAANASAGIAASAKKHIPWRAWLITLAFMCLLGFGLHGSYTTTPSSAHAEQAATTVADILWDMTGTSKGERWILVRPPTHVTILMPGAVGNVSGHEGIGVEGGAKIGEGVFNMSVVGSWSILGNGTVKFLKEVSPALLTGVVVLLLLLATVCFVIVTSTLYTVTRTSSTFPQFHWTQSPTRDNSTGGDEGCDGVVWREGRVKVASLSSGSGTDVGVLACGGGVVSWSSLDGWVWWWDGGRVRGVRDGIQRGAKRKRGRDGLGGLTVGEDGGLVGGSSGAGRHVIWDVGSGSVVGEVEGEGVRNGMVGGEVGKAEMKIVLTPVGRDFVVISRGAGVEVRELVKEGTKRMLGTQVARFTTSSPVSVLYTNRGRIYAGCVDGSLFCWAAVGDATLPVDSWWRSSFTFMGHRSPINSLNADNNVGLLVAGTLDGHVYVWDVEARMRLISIPPAKGRNKAVKSSSSQTVTSLVLLRVGETFASSTYTLACAYANEAVRFYEVTLSLEGDEGRSIPSVRRRSSTPRKDSLSGLSGLTPKDDGGSVAGTTITPTVAPWKVEVNLVKEMEQKGCIVICGFQGAVVGCRRRVRGGGKGWWWEMWMVEGCEGDEGVRVVRGVWLGRDEVGGVGGEEEDVDNLSKAEKEGERVGKGGGLFWRGAGRKKECKEDDGGRQKRDGNDDVEYVTIPKLVRHADGGSGDQDGVDGDEGGSSSSGDTSDSDDTPLPVLKIRSLVAGPWGVACGFGNHVKVVMFEKGGGEEGDGIVGNGSKLHVS
ncbi:hypothetical protein HDV00_008965 [Rhizophlyctis rosea]|nr:hypothetical protein HDV00_008965 [Rhizophlyctis rosea]